MFCSILRAIYDSPIAGVLCRFSRLQGIQKLPMPRFNKILVLTAGSALMLTSCVGSHESAAERQQNANTVAGKMGKAAHRVAKDAGKVARAAGKKLGQAAREAHDGWQEAARQDQQKAR